MALTISGTGSTAMTLYSCAFPWRNAALMSNDMSVHCIDAMTGVINIFEVPSSVGLSRGMVLG